MTPARKRALRKYAASPKGKAAARASDARMRAKPGAAAAARRHHIKKNFGLTVEQLQQMYENQEGLCAICSTLMLLEAGGASSRSPRHAVIDHDHATGKVRGLLCRCCNTGIGMLRDSARLATNAATYLAAA